MKQISFRAMGCQMMAAIDSPLPDHQDRLNQVPDWFENWEQHLSRFRPDSELSQINTGVGHQSISRVFAQVVNAALDAQHQSGRLVNPLLLNALEAAGYDRNFADLREKDRTLQPQAVDDSRTQAVLKSMVGVASKKAFSLEEAPTSGRSSSSEEIADPDDLWPVMQNWNLELDVENRKLTLPPGAHLDLGGIAKGWAADQAAHRLGKLAPTLVDAGGDVAVSAPQADGSPWPVGVVNPLDSGEQIDLVLLWEGGVATSGRDYRRWRKNGRWQHHIIDPRTGRPAWTDVLSATVVAPSTCTAEAAAKSVVILGSLEGLNWLDKRPELAGLIVLEDGTTIPSHRWLEHVWS
jgi:FAD:protein FMN transferase